MKKKDKSADWDDGRVVADMSGVGGGKHKRDKGERIELTKKERRSAARAMIGLLLPRLLFILLGFGLATALMVLWLS